MTSAQNSNPRDIAIGFVPFFEQKIQRLLKTFKDIFRIFEGLHSVQKKSLESMSFLVLPHQDNFIPEVFVFAPFPLQFSLNC